MALVGTGARAASDVDVGGFHDRALATTRQDLVGAAPATAAEEGRVQMRVDGGSGSALTAFARSEDRDVQARGQQEFRRGDRGRARSFIEGGGATDPVKNLGSRVARLENANAEPLRP